LLDSERANAIIQASQEVIDGKWNDQFVVDPIQAGAGTSHNMNVNEVIANRATQLMGGKLGEYLVHPNDHVNMAQSTNDTIPTHRLGYYGVWMNYWPLKNMVDALNVKAAEFDEIVRRTHLQDAVPVGCRT
jgi:aspartate ammonia-lyase